MKFKSLILFVVFAIFFISCDKNMKRVNPNDEGADLSEIAKICAQNNAECDYIETAIEGKMRSIFCGKCENGSCVSNKCEKNDDDTDTDTGSDDSDTDTTPDNDTDTAPDDDTDTGSADTDTKSDEDTDTVPDDEPEPIDDDETPDADENPVADEDEIDDSDIISDPTLPECNSSTTSFPCKDLSTGHIWSVASGTMMNWGAANAHCTGLNSSNYGGYSSGWHLPTIDELRTLIQECAATEPGGSCGVTESCLSSSCRDDSCLSCSSDSTGGHSKFGDTNDLWSSSTLSGNTGDAWVVDFGNGHVYGSGKSDNIYVRCVRNDDNENPEIPDDDETPDADENPVADEDEIDDSDNISNPTTLPECNSSTTSFPCKDSSTNYIWSQRYDKMQWQAAIDHCTGLNSSNYGGYSSGWHLPTIDELRTLLINADKVKNNCKVSEANNCLSVSGAYDCYRCSTCSQTGTQFSGGINCESDGTPYSDGRYSKFGDDTLLLWSSSIVSGLDSAWIVAFIYGSVQHTTMTSNVNVRCVR